MLTLPAAFIAEMIEHAQEEAPNECCGIIAGRDGTATKLFRAKNSEASPYRYSVDPKDLFRIYRDVATGAGKQVITSDEFMSSAQTAEAASEFPDPDDVAVVLFTSGTTSRPKPLS